MLRRLPGFMPLAFAAALGLFALTPNSSAQPTDTGGIKRSQEENLKLFKRFSEEVLRLAQRWEKSDSADDKERAKSLRGALKLIEEKGVEKLFKELIEGLGAKAFTTGDFNTILGKDKKLMDALTEILSVLETEDEAARLAREIADLKKAIAEITKLKKEQENIRARTENPRGDADKIAKDQRDLAQRTKDVGNALDKNGNKNDPKGGDPKGGGKEDPKAENKAEPKPGEDTGAAKPDTDANKSESKDGGMGMGTPMGGDKAGEGKPSGGMDGMGMPMGGDPKGGDKPTDPKAGGDPKAGDPKAGDPKAGMPMGGMGMGMPMGGDPKAGPPMGGEGKPQGAGKGESKPSAGQGGEAKPMDGGGMGMGGMGMGQPSPGGSKGGGQQGGGNQPPKPQGPKDPAAENVQQAVPSQEEAEDNIKKNERDQASKKQDDAIKQLEKAIAELEKRLKQLREKELAKLLGNLEERVARMLRMQIEVKAATENIDKTVKALGGKPAVAEIQKSQAEADKESNIVAEAEKALKLMEGEGSAVVFAGVLTEVKRDMEAVQRRLNETRVGTDTQAIEQDIIDQLQMMKEALKKAKQDLENKPSEPKEGDPNAQKQNNKLLDLLNELKLLKAQQEQVNKRTIMYNMQDPGEQAKDALIQAELKVLAERQKVLQDLLHKIATQANQ
jgi:hypothetical protein